MISGGDASNVRAVTVIVVGRGRGRDKVFAENDAAVSGAASSQVAEPRHPAHHVDRQGAAARREPGHRDVAFAAGGVLVVVAAEADDARPPHPRLEFRDLLHERHDGRAVGTTLWIRNGIEMILDARIPLLRLQFGHGTEYSFENNPGRLP